MRLFLLNALPIGFFTFGDFYLLRGRDRAMHVALISLYDTGATGARSLSSFLKGQGHRVSILFYGEMGRTHREFHQFSKIEYAQNAARWCDDRDRQELIQVLKKLGPDLIGISLRSTYFRIAAELTEDLKRHFTVPILWGGIHPTICPDESLQFADMVCLGEGEFPVLDLLKSLEQGREYSSIPNLWVKQDGVIFRNDLRPLNDLDPFPFADYTEEDKYYVHAHPLQLTPYPIMTSRGCPFSCTFCCNSILRDIYKGKGKYIRRRSVENVISELLFAKSTYGISEINFLDDIFVDDRKWLSPFLEEYKQKINLPFSCYLHSHYVSEDLIQALKKAGLYTACLGIQSGDERIRREIYHRAQSNQEILRSARLLNPEIAMAYDLIVDNPFESKEGLVEAIHLLLQFPHPFRVQMVTLTFFPKYPITVAAMDKGLIEGPHTDTSSNEMLMFYREERPRDIQSLYFLIASTQHTSVKKEFIRKALDDEDLLNQPKKLFHLLDGMIQEKDYVHDYRKREKNLEFLEGIEKALIIPSGEVSTLSNIFEILSEKYPDCRCTLLTGEFPRKYCAILPPEKIRAFARGERHSLEVTSYRENHSRWKLFGIDWEWIRQLREKKFDLAVLIHDNEEGRGYIHVELLAMMSGAKRILIFKPDRSAVRLNPFSFVRTALERKIRHPK